MTKEEMQVYQHEYWIAIKNDPVRHADLLKRRKEYYKRYAKKKICQK